MSKEKPLNPLTMTDEELIEHCDKQVQALRMALDMIECEKHDRRHVRWAIVDALKEWKPAQQEPVQEPVAIDGNTSDGYHTFNELYEFRKAYNAALFNEWAAGGKCSVHKSWRHHDNELCFGGGWFIVVAVLPQGQISNHYEAKDWDLFAVPEVERALFEFDGHTGADVVERLKTYTTPPAAQRQWVGLTDEEMQALWDRYAHMEMMRAIEAKLKEKNT